MATTITETGVMAKVEHLLEALDEPSRKRVLAWVVDKWGAGMFQFATFSVQRAAEIAQLPPVGGTMLSSGVASFSDKATFAAGTSLTGKGG